MSVAQYPHRPPRRGPCPCGSHHVDRVPLPVVQAEPFIPLCMESDELAAWNEANRITSGKQRARRPCDDCTLGYAASMRAEDRCNGSPRAIIDDG